MSYDIYLEIDTGGDEMATVFEVGNYTSNCSPMWALALGEPMRALNGRVAGDCLDQLARGVAHMQAVENRAAYEAMNPANGWGHYTSATEYLERLLTGCRRHPNASIRISY